MFPQFVLLALTVLLTASGATGGGVTPISIQEQIDALAAKGGGTVVVPKGEWVMKPIALKSNVTLKLEDGAVLLGSTDLADYACAETPGVSRALVSAVDVENVAIVGRGRIDGRGHCFKGRFVDPAAQPKATIRSLPCLTRRPCRRMVFTCAMSMVSCSTTCSCGWRRRIVVRRFIARTCATSGL